MRTESQIPTANSKVLIQPDELIGIMKPQSPQLKSPSIFTHHNNPCETASKLWATEDIMFLDR